MRQREYLTPQHCRRIGSALWELEAFQSGLQSAAAIAALLGRPLRTVQQHLQRLRSAGYLHTPDLAFTPNLAHHDAPNLAFTPNLAPHANKERARGLTDRQVDLDFFPQSVRLIPQLVGTDHHGIDRVIRAALDAGPVDDQQIAALCAEIADAVPRHRPMRSAHYLAQAIPARVHLLLENQRPAPPPRPPRPETLTEAERRHFQSIAADPTERPEIRAYCQAQLHQAKIA